MPNMPVILIVGAKLGCINHTLLSLSKLSQMQREPAWVIINDSTGKQDIQSINTALLAYLSPKTKLLICKHNQPKSLIPLVNWLREEKPRH